MNTTWQSSNDLTNFFINKKILSQSVKNRNYCANTDICCFSHVPKTAGTSLESILAKNFKVSETLHINAPDLNKLPALVRVKKNAPKFICGHHPLHGQLYQLIRHASIYHISLLRDPIDRVLSYYNYVKGKADHPMHRFTNDDSLINFLIKNPTPELCNGQSKRFSGYLHSGSATDQTLFTEAKDALNTCFSFVFTTCLFDEGLLLLKQQLSLKDIYYQKSNVSKKYIDRNNLDDVSLNFISENNVADIQLFDWVRKQCQMIVNQDLTVQDISQFKINNRNWKKLIDS